MASSRPGLSFIVPAYNEEMAITGTINQLELALADLDLATEIIVVDDGSVDGTIEHTFEFDNIKILRHPFNAGYGRSIKTGMRNAKYEWIGIVDADGTYDISKVPELVQEMKKGFDMVVASRENVLEFDSNIKKIFRYILIKFIAYRSIDEYKEISNNLCRPAMGLQRAKTTHRKRRQRFRRRF